LSSWRYHYDPGSVAASLFETWLAAYEAATGRLPLADSRFRPRAGRAPRAPLPTLADTLRIDSLAVPLVRQALRQALAELRAEFGPEYAEWRWERVQDAARTFPLWSSAATEDAAGPARRRFAAFRLPDGGHPTALEWGTSPLFPGLPAPGAWVAWGTPGTDPVTVRHRDFSRRSFVERERALLDSLSARPVVRAGPAEPTARLVPTDRAD
ncbi:MAG: penicillin acylase family protein, partial [Rhodothermales bacterium]|nr:penicillin acylase family protein [Rhodothermales bacterium]